MLNEISITKKRYSAPIVQFIIVLICLFNHQPAKAGDLFLDKSTSDSDGEEVEFNLKHPLTKEAFLNIATRDLLLAKNAGVTRVADQSIDLTDLQKKLLSLEIKILNKSIIRDGINNAYTYDSRVLEIEQSSFNGKSRVAVRQMVLHELMRVAEIDDGNAMASRALALVCEEREATMKLLESCSAQKVPGCLKQIRSMSAGEGVIICENGVLVTCNSNSNWFRGGSIFINLEQGQFYSGKCYGSMIYCTK